MKILLKLFTATALLLAFSIGSCKKDTPEEEPPAEEYPYTDTISAETLEFLVAHTDSAPLLLLEIMLPGDLSVDSYLMLRDPGFLARFPSGRAEEPVTPAEIRQLSAADQHALIVSRIIAVCSYYVNDNSLYPAGNDPSVEPEQRGIAYNPGSRDPWFRRFPPDHVAAECKKYKVFGLDQTGLIYASVKEAGLGWPASTLIVPPSMVVTTIWRTMLDKAGYDKLAMTYAGTSDNGFPLSALLPGDFIQFTINGDHLFGLYTGAVCISVGRATPPDCANNLLSDRGPQYMPLSVLTAASWYSVSRIWTSEDMGNVVIRDVDQNLYFTKKIGQQTWMTENLRTSKYKDGTAIPKATTAAAAGRLDAWKQYENSDSKHGTYGKLYNGYTVTNIHGLCPSGWRVPGDNDWKILESTLGMPEGVLDSRDMLRGPGVGDKLKSATSSLWRTSTAGSTPQPGTGSNESGFTGLPGGIGLSSGDRDEGYIGAWWASTDDEADDTKKWIRTLSYNYSMVGRFSQVKQDMLSVRCIKD